jgi:hypothetical protein
MRNFCLKYTKYLSHLPGISAMLGKENYRNREEKRRKKLRKDKRIIERKDKIEEKYRHETRQH